MSNKINVYFHCSSRRGCGYVLSSFDELNKRIMKSSNIDDPIVESILYLSGFEFALFQENKIYYIVIKHIDAPNDIKSKMCDCSGARIYLNIIFSSTDSETIRKLAYYIVGNFPHFSEKMYDAYNVDDSTCGMGYSFSYEKIMEYIDESQGDDIILNNEKTQRNTFFSSLKMPMKEYIKKYAFKDNEMLIAHIVLSKNTIKERFAICPKFIVTDDAYRLKNSDNTDDISDNNYNVGKYKNIWLILAAAFIIGGSILVFKILQNQ